ncbi:MAG: hypothetical protein LAP61_19490 [Acidobacteriia bacterium]|nr:hypothetical protein [Terriglobia bacterium]
MALERELETYKSKLPELLTNEGEGKYVLIHGDQVVDVFGTYEDAIKEGYSKFQLEPFLVKQIQTVEQVQFISRLLPCHTSPGR